MGSSRLVLAAALACAVAGCAGETPAQRGSPGAVVFRNSTGATCAVAANGQHVFDVGKDGWATWVLPSYGPFAVDVVRRDDDRIATDALHVPEHAGRWGVDQPIAMYLVTEDGLYYYQYGVTTLRGATWTAVTATGDRPAPATRTATRVRVHARSGRLLFRNGLHEPVFYYVNGVLRAVDDPARTEPVAPSLYWAGWEVYMHLTGRGAYTFQVARRDGGVADLVLDFTDGGNADSDFDDFSLTWDGIGVRQRMPSDEMRTITIPWTRAP